jgi:epoxyqueuosine reductase
LGEIVTTLPLAADPPLRKTCGSCTRCIPACPTGALRADYTIDATRCIADLTQRTDAIPIDMRPYIGTWVWGCDLCQLACPPNTRATIAAGDVNAPLSADTSTPSLVKLLRLRSGEFKRTYQRTAMGWRGAAILRRNAAVALGNALDRAAVPALVEALTNDPHPMVRAHAAWALGRIASPPGLEALLARLALEKDPSVLDEIKRALETNGTGQALQAV